LSNTTIPQPFIDFSQISTSQTYTLNLNGCEVLQVTATISDPIVLSPLPDLEVDDAQSITMGPLTPYVLPVGTTPRWSPGINLAENPASPSQPVFTGANLPLGVNEFLYTFTAFNSTCSEMTTQKVTLYKIPRLPIQEDELCMNLNGQNDLGLNGSIGTANEIGISYSWEAIVLPESATTGVPTNAEAQLAINNPSSPSTTFSFGDAQTGKADAPYRIQLIRTSWNAQSPFNYSLKDTVDLILCANVGQLDCSSLVASQPTVFCGENLVSPFGALSAGLSVYWSRKDGLPIQAGEFLDPVTNQPIDPTSQHTPTAIVLPPGVLPVEYILTVVSVSNDTCTSEIRVNPKTITPFTSYNSEQPACVGSAHTITGDPADPNYTYSWAPAAVFVDATISHPTLKPTGSNQNVYVTVTDPSTGCFTSDTVSVTYSGYKDYPLGQELSKKFCLNGETIQATGELLPAYTYNWTSSNPSVIFSNQASPVTNITLPPTAANGTITLTFTAELITDVLLLMYTRQIQHLLYRKVQLPMFYVREVKPLSELFLTILTLLTPTFGLVRE
jgi:hypothetical protein